MREPTRAGNVRADVSTVDVGTSTHERTGAGEQAWVDPFGSFWLSSDPGDIYYSGDGDRFEESSVVLA